jgi:uncharacterized membrane protein (UPF0127 family)
MEEKHKLKIMYAIIGVFILTILLNYIFSEFYSTSGNRIRRIYVKNNLVKAEVVESPEKREKGLSEREGLAEGRGMLFVMSGTNFPRFWMKGMRFSIDIIWIDNGRVIGFEKNISPKDSRVFTSPAAAGYVLEVPAGFCDKYNIEINNAIEM